MAIPLPVNKLSDLLRLELAMCGYTEAMTFSLVCNLLVCEGTFSVRQATIARNATQHAICLGTRTRTSPSCNPCMFFSTQCSRDEAFKWLRTEDPGNVAVTIANPATMEFQVCAPE